jgi:hypothetical protein
VISYRFSFPGYLPLDALSQLHPETVKNLLQGSFAAILLLRESPDRLPIFIVGTEPAAILVLKLAEAISESILAVMGSAKPDLLVPFPGEMLQERSIAQYEAVAAKFAQALFRLILCDSVGKCLEILNFTRFHCFPNPKNHLLKYRFHIGIRRQEHHQKREKRRPHLHDSLERFFFLKFWHQELGCRTRRCSDKILQNVCCFFRSTDEIAEFPDSKVSACLASTLKARSRTLRLRRESQAEQPLPFGTVLFHRAKFLGFLINDSGSYSGLAHEVKTFLGPPVGVHALACFPGQKYAKA